MEANAKAKAEAQDLNVTTSKAIGAPKAVEGKGKGKILSTGVNDVATSFLQAAGFGSGKDKGKGKDKDKGAGKDKDLGKGKDKGKDKGEDFGKRQRPRQR